MHNCVQFCPAQAGTAGRRKDNYCMVNEERLRHLIKMAQFDTNDGKQCKPMTQYARKDYVSMRLLGSFVTGTICYGLLMGMWGLYATEELLAKLNEIRRMNVIEEHK